MNDQLHPSFDELLPNIENLPPGHKAGFVAVIGLPNAGKSTLLNTLLTQKIAIVTPRPQTTRSRQLGIITEPTYQIVFVDTPGIIQSPRHKLDEFMMETALEALEDADLVVWVVDGVEPVDAGTTALAQRLQSLATPTLLALNKTDLFSPEAVTHITATYQELLPNAHLQPISALHNLGCDQLLQQIIEHLPLGPRYYPADQVTESYLRDIAAELVREQILLQLRDEIPHGSAVLITDYKEREQGTHYIAATIFVEREAHKKILIGAKGAQLRQIGAAARAEIQKLVEATVFLELWVKVEPKWRRNEKALQRFGYVKLE